jgi:hypothetical protein
MITTPDTRPPWVTSLRHARTTARGSRAFVQDARASAPNPLKLDEIAWRQQDPLAPAFNY